MVGRTGGPAGNALLTAWTAIVLLTGSVAELLTLINVRSLLSWHIAIGALLIPPAVMKTASTGWRMLRYYRRAPAYHEAGPPPMLLRLLGPLVVVSTLGLLATGVVLVLVGPESGHQPLLTLAGFGLAWLTLHQGFFIVWCVATGLHLLGRIVPALRITTGSGAEQVIPGRAARVLWFVVMVVGAVALATALLRDDGSWLNFTPFFFHH